MTARLEPNSINSTIHFVAACDLCNHVAETITCRKINWFEAHFPRVIEPFLVEVTDHNDRSAQNASGCRSSKPHRSRTRDIYNRTNPDAGFHRTVKAGRQDVRKHRQVADFFHRLLAIGELEQIEIGIGHHDIAGLPANPASHINISIGATGTRRVDRQANTCVLGFTATAATTSDIERD